VEVETFFTGKRQPAWQKQFAVQVPDTAIIMIFTLSALRAFDLNINQAQRLSTGMTIGPRITGSVITLLKLKLMG